MYYFEILTGACIGIGIGCFSRHLTGMMVNSVTNLNNRSRCMTIFLIKLALYFIVLVGASFIGVELMLSVAISVVITVIAMGLWNFIHD